MRKKTFIASIIILAVLGAGSYLAVKKGLFADHSQKKISVNDLLVFNIKLNNLTPDVIKFYQTKFGETKSALTKNPDDFDSWLFLGILKKGVGDYAGARDVWTYAGQIRPKSSAPFANLGDLYANFLNDGAQGEKNYKIAMANDPNNYNLYLGLADVYRYRWPGKEALYEQTLLAAAEKFPDNPNLIGPLAAYYKQTNQKDKAIKWFEELVRVSPNNQAAKDDLAELKKIQ